jgi:hypothetical protein
MVWRRSEEGCIWPKAARRKAPHAATRGYDAGKKIVGRKRHIAVDTDGRLIMINLTTADIFDSVGAQMIWIRSASAGPGWSISSPKAPTTAAR